MLLYVVDHDAVIRALVVHIAQVAEATAVHQFERAADARGALALALASGASLPGLIVLEIGGPEGAAGIDLCRWLKSLPQVHEVPIIALAAQEDDEAVLRAFEAGATEFVSKPLNLFELRARLPAAIRFTKIAAARKVAETELRRELAFNQAIVDSLSNMGHGLMVVERGRFTYVNDALCDLTGFTADALYNWTDFIQLFHPEERERLYRNHQRRLTGEAFESCYETALYGRDGRRIDVEFSVSLLVTPTHNGVACLARDIRQQIDMQQRLRHLADFDPLTGLPNRRLLRDRLIHALQRTGRSGQRLALLFIDLDGFKAINDRLGHAAGDELLRQVAERLRAAVRASDTVARLAGDEFVIILEPDAESGLDPVRVTEKLLVQLRQDYQLEAGVGSITASIGVVYSCGRAKDADSILDTADQAMYRAKQAGKNAYILVEDAASPLIAAKAPLAGKGTTLTRPDLPS